MFWFILSCQEIRSLAVEFYPLQYDIPQAQAATETLQKVFKGTPQITDLIFFDDDQYLMVLHKKGQITIYSHQDGVFTHLQDMPKISVKISSEQGLIGGAFHPRFSTNGLLYLHTTPKSGPDRTEIAEYELNVKKQGEPFSLEKKRILLEVDQPYANHNGGHLEFGVDGYLYIGLGDGGWRDDPHSNGQNKETLLGSILRIDVHQSPEQQYSIPKDNPFDNSPVYLYGIRNPWKFTVLENGKIIVADVGQNAYEEVHIASAGENLGWNIQEGRHCFLNDNCNRSAFNQPIWEYSHSVGRSITGGVVTKFEKGQNWYIVGDFTAGHIWKLSLEHIQKKDKVEPVKIGTFSILPSTFAITKRNQVYVADFQTGSVYQIHDTSIQ